MKFYDQNIREIQKELKVDFLHGLSTKEAENRLYKYGKNKITEKKKKSLIHNFFMQFCDFLIIILLAAAVISFVMSWIEHNEEYIDSIIILIIVIINAIIGVVQESKAQKAIDALKKLSAPKATVKRDGKIVKVDSELLVPGDIIMLGTGDFISADARLINSNNLACEESALTGESLPSKKSADGVFPENTSIGDRKNMVFSSCVVSEGNGIAVVTYTGMNTAVGNIAHMINKEESPDTPLQKRLSNMGKMLGIAAIVICIVIFILGLIQGVNPLEIFMISVSLAVAAIPESLPAVVTIVLALGVRKLAMNRAIIRHLPAVETLGSASVICSDKTGTLTQNKMTVVDVRNTTGSLRKGAEDENEIIELAMLCNNSKMVGNKGKTRAIGSATENALIEFGYSRGMSKEATENRYPRVKEIPFSSDRKLMSTVHSLPNGRYRIITKGASDVLVNLCTSYMQDENIYDLNHNTVSKIEQQNYNMASKAQRVLAIAFKDVDTMPSSTEQIEQNLIFCALIGMIDPPRREAKSAVRECLRAGIIPVMITGDHIITAKVIAKDLMILDDKSLAITGSELDMIKQEDLERDIYKYRVFARVSPEHKVRIVKAFQKRGDVVSMTGDGVNDAPALKAADIGCAMGKSGTDVAKGAADMILTDDNFNTIVSAVKEGRGIFDNIKKTVHFLVSCNIGEILLVLVSFLLAMPTPILAIQLLWVNLVTDSLPALALGSEPTDIDIMSRKPKKSTESFFSGGLAYNIIVEGCFVGAISVLAFTIGRYFDGNNDPIIGRTMAFAVLSLSQLIHSFNVKSDRSIFKMNIVNNKKLILSFFICVVLQVSVISVTALTHILRTSPLNFVQWSVVIVLSLSPLVVVEIEKLINSKLIKKRKI